jgi:Predicted metal-dependent hydrolase of the TIM-barrel fold
MLDLPIVDSHVHMWDPAQLNVPWLASLPLLNRPYLPQQYWQATSNIPITAIVYVEVAVAPEVALLEAQWITNLAQSDSHIQAVVAAAQLEQGEAVRLHLEALMALGTLIKGVRRNLQDEPLGFCLQPAFIQGVQMLAEYNLSFDICIRHSQLPDVIDLVRQCPGTAFVLDHIGKPDIKHGRLDPWQKQLGALASFPNVQCKISGLVTEADHQSWKTSDLVPYIQTVFESFGEDRVMFGGDWPVLLLASTYERWYETLRELTSYLSPEASRKFWGENACRFYRFAVNATQK